MMCQSEVEIKVGEILKRYRLFNAEDMKLDSELSNHGYDSLRLVEALVEIECEFDIAVDSAYLTMEYLSTPIKIVEIVCGIINALENQDNVIING